MIYDCIGESFTYEGKIYKIGDRIIATEGSEYEGLYGFIFEICDDEDKETENDTPDIYCSFDVPSDPQQIKKLEKIFSDLYREPKKIDDIILDFVIMSPEMIRVIS